MRTKQALKNAIWGIIAQFALTASFMLIPYTILATLGSFYNGLVISISRSIELFVVATIGINSVGQSALFKPVALGDADATASVVTAIKAHLRKGGILFWLGVTCVVTVYYFRHTAYIALLAVAIGAKVYVNAFFKQEYQLLIIASQRKDIISMSSIVSAIVGTAIFIGFLYADFGILVSQISFVTIHILTAIAIATWAKRAYNLPNNVAPNKDSIQNKWNALITQLAHMIEANAGVVIISIFLGIYDVSVVGVYAIVFFGVLALFDSLIVSIMPAFGNIFAQGEKTLLKNSMRLYEHLTFSLGTLFIGISMVMVLPFVTLFTQGIDSERYIQPVFAYISVVALFFRLVRGPYAALVVVSNSFKEVRGFAIIGSVMYLGLTMLLVNHIGIVGMAIAQLISLVYRYFTITKYISNKLLNTSVIGSIKRALIGLVCIAIIYVIATNTLNLDIHSYMDWIINAILVSIIGCITIVLSSMLFYNNEFKDLLSIVIRLVAKK